MKKKLIIFGTASTAELVHHYFINDSDYEPVAFCANDEYVKEDNFLGLPLLPFSKIEMKFSPKEYSFFCAVGQRELNSIRKDVYLKAKALGYSMASYISSKSDIANNVKIGEHCYIDDIKICPHARIGNNCFIHSNISHHTKVEEHCFISANVSMGGIVSISEQTFIGLNSTIRDNIIIGERCIIGAGSIIMHNTGADKVFISNETKAQRISSIIFSRGLVEGGKKNGEQ